MKKPLIVLFLFVFLGAIAFASDDAVDDEENDSTDTEAVADSDAEEEGDGESDQSDAESAGSAREFSASEIADIVTMLNDMYDSTDRFLADLNAADTAASVALSILSYAREMERLRDHVKSMAETLGALSSGGDVPDEVRLALERLNTLSPRMEALGPKIQQFAADPEVMDAIKALSAVSS